MFEYDIVAIVRRKWPEEARREADAIMEMFGGKAELGPIEYKMVIGKLTTDRRITGMERNTIARMIRQRAEQELKAMKGDRFELVDIRIEEREGEGNA